MRHKILAPLLVLAAVLIVVLATARAQIVSATGDVVEVSPPPSVAPGASESNERIIAFDEQQCYTLTQPLTVDISQPGTYSPTNPVLTPSVIPAGTVVSSHLLHFDPVGAPLTTVTRSGSATFDADVLGIIVGDTTLTASDYLGATGTTYPTGAGITLRGLEPGLNNINDDIVTLSPDRRTVTVQFESSTNIDQIRVITACNPCLNDSGNDADGDGIGDACDTCPNDPTNDADGDGICGGVDNCPTTANSDQADSDGDGIGNACDGCANDPNNDADGDGVCGNVDNCPTTANANQADADNDGIGNACDACANDPNNDADGDGICGNVDPCPNDPSNDADGDGICGGVDNCPLAANPNQADTDGDGLGDACDRCRNDPNNDADGDGVCGNVDNCPLTPNPNQADFDRDRIGDACDPQTGPPVDKSQCMNGGYMRFNNPTFKSQGECISHVEKNQGRNP